MHELGADALQRGQRAGAQKNAVRGENFQLPQNLDFELKPDLGNLQLYPKSSISVSLNSLCIQIQAPRILERQYREKLAASALVLESSSRKRDRQGKERIVPVLVYRYYQVLDVSSRY